MARRYSDVDAEQFTSTSSESSESIEDHAESVALLLPEDREARVDYRSTAVVNAEEPPADVDALLDEELFQSKSVYAIISLLLIGIAYCTTTSNVSPY